MKNKSLVIVSFAFILLLSVSIVSAGWLSELFSGKTTGEAVASSTTYRCCYCPYDATRCNNDCSPCVAGAPSPDGFITIREGVARQGAGFEPWAGTNTKIAVRDVDHATGLADIVVDTNGRLETVTVASGRDTILSDGSVLRVGALTEGRRFLRGIERSVDLTLTPASEVGVGAGVGGGAGGEQKGHKHLIVNIDDTSYKTSSEFSRDPSNNKVFVEIPCPIGQVAVDTGFNLVFKDEVKSTERLPAIEDLMHDWVNNKNSYAGISFFDPDKVINLEQSIAYVYCAKTEEAIDAQTAHFP